MVQCVARRRDSNRSNELYRVCVPLACVIEGRHIGSGVAPWLPEEPSNISRQIPEMAIKRSFTIRIKSGEPAFLGFSVPEWLGGVICKPEGAA